jgi:hypothetical protein
MHIAAARLNRQAGHLSSPPGSGCWIQRKACFDRKTSKLWKNSSLRPDFEMRIILLLLGTVAFSVGPALAQGVKDPPNYGKFAVPKTQSVGTSSRPTTINNVPTAALPSGVGLQRVYRDGKLITIVR